MKQTYTIGVDFGTQSARAVLCRVSDGAVLSESECPYAHGVMSDRLPCGTPLPPDYALQHPQDFLDALHATVHGVLAKADIIRVDIIGMGMDFTCSTPLPVDKAGTPLCFDPQFERNPHAYIKLWKHHAAQWEAARLTELMREHDPELLTCVGGRLSPEAFFPKVWQVLREAPDVFDATDRFLEVGDWLTQRLTGNENLARSLATHKAQYREGVGYPPLLQYADPRLAGTIGAKVRGKLIDIGAVSGYLTQQRAAWLGLPAGIVVTAPHPDAMASLPALGIAGSGPAALAAGTSSALILCHDRFLPVEGTTSITLDNTLPGLYGYASGQAAFGDLLGWFVNRCAPEEVLRAAQDAHISAHEELSRRAARLRPGESGLICLDWWNGNRSCLADMRLSGMLLGMTLQTRPEEIYRALMEGLGFGLRSVIDAHERAGVPIRALHVSGGISYKNPLFMQLLSNIIQRPLYISKPLPTPAVGMAILSACAAGTQKGGYDQLDEAAARMSCLSDIRYQPDASQAAAYDALYQEYIALHDYFGRGANDVMKRLRALSAAVKEQAYAKHE